MKTFMQYIKENQENQEMSEDDYKITPSGHLGGKVSVSDNFGRPKEFQDVEDALDFIRKDMEKNYYWPNIWWVSDHGNAWMIDLEGKEIKETTIGGGRLLGDEWQDRKEKIKAGKRFAEKEKGKHEGRPKGAMVAGNPRYDRKKDSYDDLDELR